MEDIDERNEKYKKLIESLPEVNKFSIEIIFSFFNLIAKFSSENKMSSMNISTIMGPILLSRQANFSLNLSKQNKAVKIVDQIINNVDEIFAVGNFIYYFYYFNYQN